MKFRESLLVGDHKIIKRYVGDKLVWRELQKIETTTKIDENDVLFNGAPFIFLDQTDLGDARIVKIQVINISGNKVIIDGSEAELVYSFDAASFDTPLIILKKSLSHYGLIRQEKAHVTVWVYLEDKKI
ncbi:hypothetical protein HMPREF3187_01546 [Aerococcus christensenii]|uniref:Uncharacterized protein n=1 Tax=Aerococcus christensenii TaxID=87541 RepID=A0A133XSY2_9LACT|nr:hypothetical protein [Aerococcus christensenii]KXB34044.1 hypothetical protein HMPREF3187_01546 [Aerococcus christensenii]